MEHCNCDEIYKFLPRRMKNFRETDVWICGPSPRDIFIYSLIIPTISALGIVGNVLILAVLGRKSLKASTYTYLAVLAGANLISCILLVFSGLSKGVFWGKSGWTEFDAFVNLPVCSVSSNVAVLATVCVTLDRLVLVSGPLRCKPPKFCDCKIARKLMWCSLPIALVCNIPYFFIFKLDGNGHITTTEFFTSRWYDLHNWVQLSVFGVIPAVFLLIGNGIMLYSVCKVIRRRRILMEKHARDSQCVREQARLTVTLVGIVFVFLAGQCPTHFASKKSAVSLLYGGDPTKIHKAFLDKFRVWVTFLHAVSSSASFVLYCLLSPQFLTHLKDLVTGVRDGPRKNELKNTKQPPKIQLVEPNRAIDF